MKRTTGTTDFSALLTEVRSAGLLERRTGFYLCLTAVLLAALVAAIIGVLTLGDSWWQLAIAGGSGLILAQVGYVAHEAAHRRCSVRGRPTTGSAW